jgi:pyrroloquinoline quinone biosynthesis protein B
MVAFYYWRVFFSFFVLCLISPAVFAQEAEILILGTAQDGGSPHISCTKQCCRNLFESPDSKRKVVSLALFDRSSGKKYLFEATPEMPDQLDFLAKYEPEIADFLPAGIFLTHAHIGHYTGLMYLGREAMGAKAVPVYCMPQMKSFLENNGPWDQLVKLNNIRLESMEETRVVRLSDKISVKPFLVPHRDEYSETVGYEIIGPSAKAIFIPDRQMVEMGKRYPGRNQ